jgi:hypothetical protein
VVPAAIQKDLGSDQHIGLRRVWTLCELKHAAGENIYNKKKYTSCVGVSGLLTAQRYSSNEKY